MTLEKFRVFVNTGTWTREQRDMSPEQCDSSDSSRVHGRRTLISRRGPVTIAYSEDFAYDKDNPAGSLTTSVEEMDWEEVWVVHGANVEDDDSIHEMDGYVISDDLSKAFSKIDYSDITGV